MYLTINRDEVVEGLAQALLKKQLLKTQPQWPLTTAYIKKLQKRWRKARPTDEVDEKVLKDLLYKDLRFHTDQIILYYKKNYRPLINWLADNYDRLGVSRQQLLDLYLASSTKNFVKTLGSHLTDDPQWIIAGEPIPDDRPVLIRGTSLVHHEFLIEKIQNKKDFWFIDTGYTNFLSGQKKWHRIVKNHLHHRLEPNYFPADRLKLLSSMPAPWRENGDKILVIENSENYLRMHGIKLSSWRQKVIKELARYSSRKVVFRPKEHNLKIRDSLYHHLLDSDYYCVVTYASAASIEAVWAGIPIITLSQHISSLVARTKLSMIDNLYRGPIGDWLCALTYHQFTKEEIYDGTAIEIVKKYHV